MNPTVIPAIFLAKDKMSATMARMSNSAKKFANESAARFEKAGKAAFAFGKKAFVTGALIAAPLALAAKTAVDFEDKMSDIGKTTGLQGKDLRDFGDDILQMSTKTRSSIDDLATIAEIGGRLGIVGKKDLKAFTVSANEFAVALGGDFSGGVESAITQFGKVTSLFRDTKDLDIAPALKKAGSAMNALSAKGVNVEGLTDFSLRVGALPEVFRPSLASTTALGATLQKSGVDAQIASSGFSNFITTASQNLPAFASAMGISQKEAQALINTDTAAFFAQFSAKMKGVPADQLGIKLKKLKLNSLEVQKAVGGMSGSLELYTELSALSNEQLAKGTSITQEYNTKNNNTAGKIAKLKNQFMALAITVGNALLPVVSELVSSISPLLQSAGRWMQRNKALVSTIAKIALAVSAFSFALSGVAFVIGGVQKAIAVASIAFKAFNLLFLASPIGGFVVALAAVAAGAYAITKAFTAASASEQLNNEIKDRALEKSADQRLEVVSLFNTLKKLKSGTDEYRSTIQKIDAMQPGITKKYLDQNGVLKNAIGLQKELTASIIKRAEAEVRAEMYKESFRKELDIREGRDKTAAESLLEFTGSDETAKKLRAVRVVNEQFRQRELEKQINQDNASNIANPEQAKQQSMINNTLNINLSGLPEGATATANGKQVPVSSGGTMQKKFAGTN